MYPDQSPIISRVSGWEFTSGDPMNYVVNTAAGRLTMEPAQRKIVVAEPEEAAAEETAPETSASAETPAAPETPAAAVTLAEGSLFEGDSLSADGKSVLHGNDDVTENYIVLTEAEERMRIVTIVMEILLALLLAALAVQAVRLAKTRNRLF